VCYAFFRELSSQKKTTEKSGYERGERRRKKNTKYVYEVKQLEINTY